MTMIRLAQRVGVAIIKAEVIVKMIVLEIVQLVPILMKFKHA